MEDAVSDRGGKVELESVRQSPVIWIIVILCPHPNPSIPVERRRGLCGPMMGYDEK